jgi:hypothetical protein
MHRRPKLSLVTNTERKKRQALDFPEAHETKQESPQQTRPHEGNASPPPSPGFEQEFSSERLISEQERAAQQQPAFRPSGRTLLKALAIVATAALTLYLVKRRLL